jgi:hypothetical protein
LPGASDEPSAPGEVEVDVVGVEEFVMLVGGEVGVGTVGLAVPDGGAAMAGLGGDAGLAVWARAGNAAPKATAAADNRSLFILRFPSRHPTTEA